MKFKFQSFVDISTSASSMQVIQWSVGGNEVINRCRHLFPAYKYFKLGKISVKMIPASTLPVDPLGLSYSDSDPQTVDPRDQMNPGLVRITNGEDIFTNVSSLSEGQQIQAYNAMMLDPRWSKFMLQTGFQRSAYPLYWQVGQLSQDHYPGATVNVPSFRNTMADGTVALFPWIAGSPSGTTVVQPSATKYGSIVSNSEGAFVANSDFVSMSNSSSRGLFQVGHRGKLGFLPTDYYQDIRGYSDGFVGHSEFGINNVPQVSVITCVLPKAYKTIYYYRVFITEEVIFAGLRSAPVDSRYGLDQFVFNVPVGIQPGNGWVAPALNNHNNGGDLP